MKNNKLMAKAFKDIVRYSLQLVVIMDTQAQERDRIAAYADYLAKADKAVPEKRGFDSQYHQSTIAIDRAGHQCHFLVI